MTSLRWPRTKSWPTTASQVHSRSGLTSCALVSNERAPRSAASSCRNELASHERRREDHLPASKVVPLPPAVPQAVCISRRTPVFHPERQLATLFVRLGGQSGGQLLTACPAGWQSGRVLRPSAGSLTGAAGGHTIRGPPACKSDIDHQAIGDRRLM